MDRHIQTSPYYLLLNGKRSCVLRKLQNVNKCIHDYLQTTLLDRGILRLIVIQWLCEQHTVCMYIMAISGNISRQVPIGYIQDMI